VVGVNSVFTTDLEVGDYIKFNSDTSNSYRVTAVTTNSALTIDRDYPLSNIAGVNTTRDEAVLVDNDKASYIFPIPNDVIKELSDITIRTRRVFFGTLTANVVALTTAVGSTFASRTDQDYFAVAVTGGTAGKIYKIESDEIFISSATVDDVEVISAICAERLRASGSITTMSTSTSTGVQSATDTTLTTSGGFIY
jgi:hypothetical protein